MYESPIMLYQQINNIAEQVSTETENYIYNYVLKLGIDVDKNELVRALNYDRGQYQKGYDDGYQNALAQVSMIFADDEYIIYKMKQKGMIK